jgi:hypothetical protein
VIEDAATRDIKDPLILGRRRMMQCLAWSGAGLAWVINGGVPKAFALDSPTLATELKRGSFVFAQISDSHIGFAKEANPDTAATLQLALDEIKIIRPAFMLHTGDVTHLSKPAEFDTAAQLLTASHIETHYVPGEHDVLDETASLFFDRFTPQAKNGWYSFDYQGVHFVALVNVLNFQAGGLGRVGTDQLHWLEDDLRNRSASTPIVVFTHIPLWDVYREWGWATDDGEQVLALLRRFGSVTVLNGHIHQLMQKTEGNLVFHSARSTAYPQPEPGKAAGPGPVTVPAGQLQSVLGISSVRVEDAAPSLQIADYKLNEKPGTEAAASRVRSALVGGSL